MARSFTLEQANRMLPLVRRIVQDIVSHYEQWQQVVGEFEVATGKMRDVEASDRAEAMQIEAQRIAEEIQHFIEELEALGVQFKGFDLGLVDFPSEMDGRPVLLCWKLNEPEIAYWHEVDGGYAGRQPLVPMFQP